ncbi:MAG TPA: DUF2254 domain-containing protein [Solirubrobacteraceae bacterium]|nr:DUF2254 domain-containing protein [Solirubrobacteraceae bacterium]
MPRTHVREVVLSSFWVLPSLCVAAAIGLGVGLLALDHNLGPTHAGFLFPGPPSGARSLLSSIIQAMITFTGLVFSITMVVLQLTSSQFSPRVLRTFLRDRTIQLSLGTFLATFVYAMVVMRGVRGTSSGAGVPRVAVTVTVALVVLSVAVFIHYVAHITQMIRAASIIDSLGRESRTCLSRRFSAALGADEDPGDQPLGPVLATVSAAELGVIVSISAEPILRHAREHDVQVAMVPSVGDFVPAGAPLLTVHAAGPDPGGWNEDTLRGDVMFDKERSLEQDLAFGVRQLVDIAQKALSPGVNDPTTAVQAIDVIHDLLRRLAPLRVTPHHFADADGVVRLVVPELSFAGYLGLGVGQIWPYAESNVQVPMRLANMLSDLLTVARPEHLDAIHGWLDVVQGAARRDPTWNTTLSGRHPVGGGERTPYPRVFSS